MVELESAVRAAITDLRTDPSLISQIPEIDPDRPGGEENWATLRSHLVAIPLSTFQTDLFALVTEVTSAERALDPRPWQDANAHGADLLLQVEQLQDELAAVEQQRDEAQRGRDMKNTVDWPALGATVNDLQERAADLEAQIAQRQAEWRAVMEERELQAVPLGPGEEQDAYLRLEDARNDFERGLRNLLRTMAVAWWREQERSGGLRLAGAPSTPSSADDEAIAAEATISVTSGDVPRSVAVPIPLGGGFTREHVGADEAIEAGRDRLGFNRYVDMFAALITDPKTEMPVSVGLYAPWGSGKSTFIGLLRDQVQRRSAADDPPFNIRIVNFNAWHYSDTNLWASLADHLFTSLGPQEADPDEKALAVGEDRLEQARSVRKETEARLGAATARTAEARRKAEDASNDVGRKVFDLLKASQNTPFAGTYFRAVGIADDVEQGKAIARSLEQTSGDLRTTNGNLRAIVRRPLFLCVVAVAVLVAGATATWQATAAAGSAVLVTLGAWASMVNRGATAVAHFTTDLRASLDRAAEGSLGELRDAEADERKARIELERAEADVDRLQAELALLQPRARLYQFLSERAHSAVYSGQLSLVSTMRRDLEELGRLLKKDTSDPGEDDAGTREGEPARPRIDRIVLFIDDLDRCTTSQVMNVLQAVHVLLSTDLFVVVLGVDQRWLVHSVELELTGERRDHELRPQLPREYLEKIITLSFTLPSMNADQLHGLLAGMVDEVEVPQGLVTDGARAAAEPATRTPAGVAQMPAPATVPRAITEPELDALAAVGPFVRSPRAARRLVNTYRMFRAVAPDPDAFLGLGGLPPEYPAVALMLAMVATHGRLGQLVLLGDLRTAKATGVLTADTWGDVVRSAQPRVVRSAIGGEPDAWSNEIVGSIDDRDVVAWRELARDLMATEDVGARSSMEAHRLWAPSASLFCVGDVPD